MADSSVAVTAGVGTEVDTRTEGTNGNHRQVVVLGDPATNAGVAPVDVTNGLAVQIIPALPAGANVIGSTVGQLTVFTHTPSLDTVALDQDDVLADTEVIAAVFRADDVGGILESLTVLDEDNNGEDLRIYFLDADVVMGTEGSAISISDGDAVNILGSVTIAAADFEDLIGSKVANINNIGLVLQPASGTDDLYVAIVGGATNTSTYTASGIKLRLGIKLY